MYKIPWILGWLLHQLVRISSINGTLWGEFALPGKEPLLFYQLYPQNQQSSCLKKKLHYVFQVSWKWDCKLSTIWLFVFDTVCFFFGSLEVTTFTSTNSSHLSCIPTKSNNMAAWQMLIFESWKWTTYPTGSMGLVYLPISTWKTRKINHVGIHTSPMDPIGRKSRHIFKWSISCYLWLRFAGFLVYLTFGLLFCVARRFLI